MTISLIAVFLCSQLGHSERRCVQRSARTFCTEFYVNDGQTKIIFKRGGGGGLLHYHSTDSTCGDLRKDSGSDPELDVMGTLGYWHR